MAVTRGAVGRRNGAKSKDDAILVEQPDWQPDPSVTAPASLKNSDRLLAARSDAQSVVRHLSPGGYGSIAIFFSLTRYSER